MVTLKAPLYLWYHFAAIDQEKSTLLLKNMDEKDKKDVKNDCLSRNKIVEEN